MFAFSSILLSSIMHNPKECKRISIILYSENELFSTMYNKGNITYVIYILIIWTSISTENCMGEENPDVLIWLYIYSLGSLLWLWLQIGLLLHINMFLDLEKS